MKTTSGGGANARARRCWGRTPNLRPCSRRGSWVLFCHDHKRQWIPFIVILLGLAASLVTIVTTLVPPSQPETRPRVVVWPIIEANEVLDELEELTRSRFPELEFDFRPNFDNHDAWRDFKEGRADLDKIDIILGGLAQYHEATASKLRQIDIGKLPDIELPPQNRSQQSRWFGWYVNILGIVWDPRRVPANWEPKTFEDLLTLPDDVEIMVPRPTTSSSARALLGSLTATHGEEEAERLYERLLSLPNAWVGPGIGPQPVEIVARSDWAVAIEWLHDARVESKKRQFSCLRATVPDDFVPTLSAASVSAQGRAAPEDSVRVLRFFLSREVVELHYRRAFRLPARRDVYDELSRAGDPWTREVFRGGFRHQDQQRVFESGWASWIERRDAVLNNLEHRTSPREITPTVLDRLRDEKQTPGCLPPGLQMPPNPPGLPLAAH